MGSTLTGLRGPGSLPPLAGEGAERGGTAEPTSDRPAGEGRYISVRAKLVVAQVLATCWLGLSAWVSDPWLASLSHEISWPAAIVSIVLLAYLPGWMVAFLVVSLLLDRQPPLREDSPLFGVTVILPAHNEEDRIAHTLSYLSRQDYAGDIRIILVDNASTDRTREVAEEAVRRLGLQLTYLYEGRRGKSHALNTALAHVSTPLVISLDADTALHPQAVRRLVARQVSAPDDVVAVAGAVLVRNSRQNLWTRMQEWDYFLGIASVKRMQGLYQGTLVAQGAFSLYRTEALQECGGWPDAIGEDIVLTWRLMGMGCRVYFEPTALAFTEVPARLRHFARQRARWARGMIEGFRAVKPWNQPRPMSVFLTGTDLLIPPMDLAYTFLWMPGLVMACFGLYWFVGLYTAVVLPLTLLVNGLLYSYQRKRVFAPLGLRVRSNRRGLLAYILFYQFIMSPVSVLGYAQELLGRRRRWK
jgi:biofilm PGA synthesis N-glycosyltransferase PgaC